MDRGGCKRQGLFFAQPPRSMLQLRVMELFIIRHAQSYNNTLTDQRDRVVDPPLTKVGRRQAQLVGEFTAHGQDTDFHRPGIETISANGRGLALTRLYCSAMLRALDTAQAIGRETHLRPQVWIDIHEEGGMWLDHGDAGIVGYPGMTRAEISAQFPECTLPEAISESGWWTLGQEELTPFRARAERVAAELREMAMAAADERIAIVTHGGFGAQLLKAIFAVPPDQNLFFYHNNTGITKVRYRSDGRISMRYQNRLSHLPPELAT
jgi:2,3-bisphosphoglycerate-dependent phosphoglycerate mutase